ncbi:MULTISPECIES: SDR family oxidoreductase [Ensifer]|uniref:SDR family oxidoreductase n=1 Tax=Ensifer TaxID=106591 RepID=UPI0008E5C5F9|nr:MULTISPECIES: SDR family oxidoreductase [Ensifer]MBD9543800.1 SDR family oxidoreductase [Ensifer sp. ENS04]QHG73286.1 SDR family oxidoreductase [Ensifer adhaerens]SFH14878.1 3-oxoacyl-[acyl-carrier protein] reductase [Ensifer sp. OV372]
MSNSNKVALVTGASRGIGAEIARRLARDGFKIVVNCAGRTEAAKAVADEIIGGGGDARVIQADVSDAGAVAAMFDTATQAFGGVDVVVNSAGIMKLAPIADVTDDVVDDTIAINLKGTFNVCREAAKRLRNDGRIINVSSSVIGMRLPTYGIYIATKAAVEGLTQVLAQEMRGRGIRVNAIAPGPVATELFLSGKSPELLERMAKMNPLERLAEPEDIARVVSFLAGPEGAWINGQVIRANGGMC